MASASAVIAENRYAVVQKLQGGQKRCSKLTRKDSIVIEKLKFYPDAAFGLPYGTFLVRNGHLVKYDEADQSRTEATEATAAVAHTSAAATVAEQPANGSAIDDTTTITSSTDQKNIDADSNPPNNETYMTSQTIQKLHHDDIELMKRQGTTGDEIIDRLVDGHKLMDVKTEYSKDKYIRRKHKKHGDRLLILRPSIRLLCDIYYHKDAERVANLRIDLLSMVLSLADVRAGRRVLVAEQCQGLVSAAVLDRLSSTGQCIHLHKGDQAQSIPCLHAMNFEQKVLDRFYPLQVDEVFSSTLSSNGEERPTKAEVDSAVTVDDVRKTEEKLRKMHRVTTAREAVSKGELDSLIIAVRSWSAKELLARLICCVAPSTSFVVYSPYVQPLLECYQYLKEQGETALNVQLQDSFYRRHQVLPDRTHPEMQQYVTGGYLLSGVTVLRR